MTARDLLDEHVARCRTADYRWTAATEFTLAAAESALADRKPALARQAIAALREWRDERGGAA